MRCLLLPGGFNRSAQHLLILRGEEVCHGDITDLVHSSAEGRAVGAMEERAKCCGHLTGAGKEEQDRRFPPPWTVEEHPGGESFIIRDAKGQGLAYVYFEDESVRQ